MDDPAPAGAVSTHCTAINPTSHCCESHYCCCAPSLACSHTRSRGPVQRGAFRCDGEPAQVLTLNLSRGSCASACPQPLPVMLARNPLPVMLAGLDDQTPHTPSAVDDPAPVSEHTAQSGEMNPALPFPSLLPCPLFNALTLGAP